MLAIRRTSSFALRSRKISAVTFHASHTEHRICDSSHVNHIQFPESPCVTRVLNRYYANANSQTTLNHHYSSMAGKENNGEEEDDDLMDGFSELRDSTTDEIQETNVVDEGCDDIIVPKETDQQKRFSSVLCKVIMDSPTVPVRKALDKWLENGEKVDRSDISMAILELKKRKMYGKALQLLDWLESQKHLEFTEKDYSFRIDIIAKTRGLMAAENYLEMIPESFKSAMVYETLLANCVQFNHTTKAEQVINKMKELRISITPFACNQLLLLYNRTDKKKIADVLLLMERENVKPTLFTYRMLADIKGQSHDITGMEKVVETMKVEGIDPDIRMQAVLARHYIYAGLIEKAKVILQEMEGNDLNENRLACSYLLPLYATLQSVADVDRVWDVCKPNPQFDECTKAILAYGKLKKVEVAEVVFDQMSKNHKRISYRHYAVMLRVYANNKMLSKGENLVKQMTENGCRIGPLTWDPLVKLYIEAGEVEKADSVLPKASEKSSVKPLFSTYLVIMEEYAKRGDIHNAEKTFSRMRQGGYVRLKQYHCLLKTYKNAKVSAFGFRERMKADNVLPDKALAELLTQVDAFKRTAVSDLLD